MDEDGDDATTGDDAVAMVTLSGDMEDVLQGHSRSRKTAWLAMALKDDVSFDYEESAAIP